ncbi:hypothetical protein YN1_0530 [Nanoarchaeota archaeon]
MEIKYENTSSRFVSFNLTFSILFFIFFLFFSKSFLYLIFISFILSIILLIFTVSFYFIFSPIYLLKRGDSRYIRRLISMFLSSFIPVSYSLSFFFFYKYTIILSPSILLQEFRNIVLKEPVDYNLLFLSIISSLIYLIIGIILFDISYRRIRKEGTLTLQ